MKRFVFVIAILFLGIGFAIAETSDEDVGFDIQTEITQDIQSLPVVYLNATQEKVDLKTKLFSDSVFNLNLFAFQSEAVEAEEKVPNVQKPKLPDIFLNSRIVLSIKENANAKPNKYSHFSSSGGLSRIQS